MVTSVTGLTLTVISRTGVFLIKNTDSIIVTNFSSTHGSITVHYVGTCPSSDGLQRIGGLIDVG